MTYLRPLAFILTTTTLSACGGGGGSDDTPATQLGYNPENIQAAYNPITDRMIITNGSNLVSVPRDLEFNNGNIKGYSGLSASENFRNYAVYGETTSGAGQAVAFASGEDNVEPGSIALETFVVRDGTTTIPETGSTAYSGDYVGIVTEVPSATNSPLFFSSVEGDVSLVASFDDSTIEGDITNRQAMLGVQTYDDITLNLTSIQDGGFQGATTGGARFNQTDATTDVGQYIGLLVGSNGEEAVGGLTITHDFGVSQKYIETGIFVAD